MTAYVLDTHVWAWAIKLDNRLPSRIASLLLTADSVYVSAVSFYEIAQKVRLGKWHDMEEFSEKLPDVLLQQGGRLAALSGEICQLAGMLDWPHRDPFDRMIAATSLHMKLPLVSADPVFDGLADRPDWPGRIW